MIPSSSPPTNNRLRATFHMACVKKELIVKEGEQQRKQVWPGLVFFFFYFRFDSQSEWWCVNHFRGLMGCRWMESAAKMEKWKNTRPYNSVYDKNQLVDLGLDAVLSDLLWCESVFLPPLRSKVTGLFLAGDTHSVKNDMFPLSLGLHSRSKTMLFFVTRCAHSTLHYSPSVWLFFVLWPVILYCFLWVLPHTSTQ